jgi:hypothetical protein
VEPAVEGDDVRPAGGMAGQLHRRLDALGPRVRQQDPGVTGEGRERGQALAQLDVAGLEEVRSRVVQVAAGLALDRGDHGGVRVTRRGHGDAGVGVQQQVAVDILDDGAG